MDVFIDIYSKRSGLGGDPGPVPKFFGIRDSGPTPYPHFSRVMGYSQTTSSRVYCSMIHPVHNL